jgi:hypothetical protein
MTKPGGTIMKIKQRDHQASDLPIELAQPARRALANAGIQRLDQLTKFSEIEVKQLHGIGPNALAQLHRALRAKGLSFANEEKIKKVIAPMKKTDSKDGMTPSQLITKQIAELTDWRGKMYARLRELILDAAPDITEEWKWDTAVWSEKGLVCSVGVFKDHVKLNFFKGASLKDPKGLFNAGLDAKATRAIDFREGDDIDAPALENLIRSAVAYNMSGNKMK